METKSLIILMRLVKGITQVTRFCHRNIKLHTCLHLMARSTYLTTMLEVVHKIKCRLMRMRAACDLLPFLLRSVYEISHPITL